MGFWSILGRFGPKFTQILAKNSSFQKFGCTIFVDLIFATLMQKIRKNKATDPVLSI